MGAGLPKPVVDEKTKWALDHELRIHPGTQSQQHALLRNFRHELHQCWIECDRAGFKYRHYFVTDLTWTIEFLQDGVAVHSNRLPAGYTVETSFRKTDQVIQRMRKVCGAMNYSVTLRNCEQLARYIANGSWVSYQMIEGAYFGSKFVEHMMDSAKKKLNRLPRELVDAEPIELVPLFADHPGFLRYTGSPQGLSTADRDAFNVLVIGPSGCGKSRLVNMLFNLNVSESAPSAHGVTRQIKILSGEGMIENQMRKVNVIDTIGLCDSHLKASAVLELIKSSLKVNFAFIDQVIVICSDRIAEMHSDNIKQLLEWLKYQDYYGNFTFIYNKADGLSEAVRETNVACMCESLGVLNHSIVVENMNISLGGDRFRGFMPTRVERFLLPKVFSTGFPPTARHFQEVTGDFCKIVDSALTLPDRPERLPVQESWCSIL